ncbi:helix-turn-helix transcriptional regulator [Nocardioides sp. URHA0020]|uniref:helix-turn-helix transcriptional regulator n=1 Tax=Nocardioides sp. URHA0020 TaxID=1380392 RepID=UPI000686FDDF|nr:helix-turn-helix transcriptional regulator [Nocardioides sp. URHA0020]
MTRTDSRGLRGVVPLLLVSLVVVMVAAGMARGIWVANLHNGLLAMALTGVGAYVLLQRPGHREGVLLLSAGVVEGVMFLGRQVGHTSSSGAISWWGWLGVWPLVVALALTTFAVIGFPDGRLPSRRWRPVAAVVVGLTLVCATLSATSPVEYASAGVRTAHPIRAVAPDRVDALWSGIAHPLYFGLQVLWVLALAARWRAADGHVRRQLVWLVGAAAISVVALVVGLAGWATPVPGLITAALLPVVAGWAIVHGQHVAAYSALTWLSRTGAASEDLPTDLARAVAEASAADGAALWMGPEDHLQVVGLWPETGADLRAEELASLQGSPDLHVRVVQRHGAVTGALSVNRPRSDRLSLAEDRLLDDLAFQAALVIEHLNLSDVIAGQRRAGHLDGLSQRELDVLELMARGLSNAAICDELHLSIKTVEPVVSAIFTKLGLHPAATSNRRVLAVLAFVRS